MKRNEESLQEQLLKAQHRFMKVHRDLCFQGLPKSEFMMLDIIERECPEAGEGVYASDIARKLKITAPAVSKMLKSMEEKGYVERRTDKRDRRNVIVTITPSGKEAGQWGRKQMEEFIAGVVARFGEKNARELITLMNQYAEITREENLNRKKRMQEEYHEADL